MNSATVTSVNIAEKLAAIHDHWTPRIACTINTGDARDERTVAAPERV